MVGTVLTTIIGIIFLPIIITIEVVIGCISTNTIPSHLEDNVLI